MGSNNVGIGGLIAKNVNEVAEFVDLFIKSSLNIRNAIIDNDNMTTCMFGLISDTYMCNIVLRYVGMMCLISSDPKWETVDNQLMDYSAEFYNNEKFRNKLLELHNNYSKIHEKTKENYDYCRFLERMLNRSDLTKRGNDIKKNVRMLEKRIFNIMNINPVVKISTRHFKTLPKNYENEQGRIVVPLTQMNYHNIMDQIDDMNVRHQIETQYMSRTKTTMNDFSKLIVLRKLVAEYAGYSTYFKYINRGKYDNSETIKELIVELNKKINKKISVEINKIHQYYSRKDLEIEKLSLCDIIKYVRLHKNNTKFDPKTVFDVIFTVFEKYFNITFEKTNEKGWNTSVIVYTAVDLMTKKIFGRLYLDILFDENKKVSEPISIRLADKMQINPNTTTCAEIALIANYGDSSSADLTIRSMTYMDIIRLFKEFGYILNSLCYESRVGLINYDEEFSNYLPLLMEYIAWDSETIRMITKDCDPSIADHIKISRYFDMMICIKLKCVGAKFDHLLHNSEPLLDIIIKAIEKKGDAVDEILETYKDIYKEMMEPISEIFISDASYVDPNTIIQEINGSQGVLYANLMNEIFAYSTYWMIKNNKTNDPTDSFRNCVLSNGTTNYREVVRNYLKKMNVNHFDLYVKNVIKIDETPESPIEDTNYFDEDNYDSDSDKGDIVQINRINGLSDNRMVKK